MKELFDFSLPKKYLDINAKFQYNSYIKDETTINDIEIKLAIPEYRCINLNINSYSSNIFNSSYLNEIDINEIESLQNLKQIDIDKYFNKLNNINNDFNCMFIDKNKEEKLDIIKKLNINTNNYNSAIYLDNNSIKIKINKKFNSIFDKFVINKTIKNNIIYKDYENIFKNENIFDNLKKDSNFIDFDLNIFKSKLSYDYSYKKNIHIGFLIEKYNVDNNDLIKLNSKFVFNNNIKNNNNDAYSGSINDINICYGKKYFYLIYNVYYVTLPQKENYNILNDYIICDYPVSTDIIETVENIRPNPPNGLFLNYNNHNKTIELNWTKAFTNQNDIKAYMIFRRNSIDDAYSLIHYGQFFDKENTIPQFNIDQKLIKNYNYNFQTYKDKEFDNNKINIYTLCSIDAHGMISNYSEQVAIYINKISGNYECDLVSKIGAPIDMPNLLINRRTKFFENDDKIETILPIVKNKKNFTLYCTPDYNNITLNDNKKESILKEKYIFSIFKIESSSLYKDIITIKNFNTNT